MSNYNVEDLEVLSPRDHVRLRKGMYIGDAADPSPLFNEIFDNAIDECQAGFSKRTYVLVDYSSNKYLIEDYGRGFPQGKLKDPNSGKEIEALELLCTTAFSGGKFNNSSYRISTGLHGVGLLVTNSLSKEFSVDTWRDCSRVIYRSELGKTIGTSKIDYLSKYINSPSGTRVVFTPDESMFTDSVIPLSHILMRCKVASAFGMKIDLVVIDKNGNTKTYDTSSTIFDLLPEEDEGISEYYRYSFTVKDDDTGEFASVALKYTSDTRCFYRGYTNLLYNPNGGSHHKMLDKALYESWDKYRIPNIKYNDIFLGLRAVIAVFISDGEFSSQTKEKLSVPVSRLDVLKDKIVSKIQEWLDNNDEIRESLIKRFQEYRSAQNKLISRKEIRSLLCVNTSKNGSIRRTSNVRKLRECDSKTREGTELFICEGDSAVGSAVQARDSSTQAVIPVRGKVFNVARCTDPKEALSNEETRSIVNAIGAGICDEADPEKSRYERIIFMADADEDGKEIVVLLSGMFINLLPSLVKEGMVYISLPPLYGWKDRQGYHFANKLSEIPEDVKDFSRYKGLGEMDAEELRVSTMDPSTRRLVKLNYPDDIRSFNSILTSSSVKYKMLEDQGVIKFEV